MVSTIMDYLDDDGGDAENIPPAPNDRLGTEVTLISQAPPAVRGP